MEVSIYLKKF